MNEKGPQGSPSHSVRLQQNLQRGEVRIIIAFGKTRQPRTVHVVLPVVHFMASLYLLGLVFPVLNRSSSESGGMSSQLVRLKEMPDKKLARAQSEMVLVMGGLYMP